MPEHKYEVRTMTRAEVDLAVDWAALEGWNPGLHDADCYYKTDPNGFFIGMLNDEPLDAFPRCLMGIIWLIGLHRQTDLSKQRL
jgi:hypothetical protein